ncbi:hypothetical protein HDU76_008222, partial [Blyttiomyces sp. JEL0837]
MTLTFAYVFGELLLIATATGAIGILAIHMIEAESWKFFGLWEVSAAVGVKIGTVVDDDDVDFYSKPDPVPEAMNILNENPGSPDGNTRLPSISTRPDKDVYINQQLYNMDGSAEDEVHTSRNQGRITKNSYLNGEMINDVSRLPRVGENDRTTLNEMGNAMTSNQAATDNNHDFRSTKNTTTINEQTFPQTYPKNPKSSTSATESPTSFSARESRSKSFSSFRLPSGAITSAKNVVIKQIQSGVNALLVRNNIVGSSSPSHFLETLLAVPRNWFTLVFEDRELEMWYQVYANEILEMRQARIFAAAFIFSLVFALAS